MNRRRLKHELGGAAGGAVTGAIAGAIAGPVGSVTGAVLGGLAGAAGGRAIELAEERSIERDRALDEVIGVNGGELGAPNLEHPPARIGAYSAAASGAGADLSGAPASGPITTPADAEE
jgi:hypothetical protein